MKLFKRNYYEKLFAKRAETIQDYQLQILHAQEKIKELQAKCPHENYTVGFWSWRPGALHPCHLCDACGANIGDATDEERKELWKSSSFGVKTDTD